DTRNSKVFDIVRELSACGIAVQVHDPLANDEETECAYGVKLLEISALKPADAVILAVAHSEYVTAGWPLLTRLLKDGRGIVLDVKAKLNRGQKPKDIELWRL